MPIPNRDSIHILPIGVVIPLLPTFKPGEEQWLQTRGVKFPKRQVALIPYDKPTANPTSIRFVSGQLCVVVNSTCPLLKDNLCRLHGKVSKPKICQSFPTNLPKSELRSLHPKCGYLEKIIEHALAN
jgi:Fe-S-cluster containining protein